VNGRPVPLDGRAQLRAQLARLRERGYGYVAGLEVELYITRLARSGIRLDETGEGQPGPAPEVEIFQRGYQFLSDARLDGIGDTLEAIRDGLCDVGLPPRSIEDEWGPGQIEFTYGPMEGLTAADAMVLFRSAVKQVARRHGYHATFMCRPRLPNVMSSGWHLHQSLKNSSGENAFVPKTPDQVLSQTGQRYLAGLLAHARGASALSTPTINGYKRYRPYSLAPDRVIWGKENRGAMLRVIGGPGDSATRIENRIGEPAANPYLYFASQVYCGLDGLERKLPLPPSADTPYEAQAEPLPHTLAEALAALREDACLEQGLGKTFVEYFSRIKEAEIARFNLDVSEWEQREYFDLF
jgi:glutamine synthetase